MAVEASQEAIDFNFFDDDDDDKPPTSAVSSSRYAKHDGQQQQHDTGGGMDSVRSNSSRASSRSSISFKIPTAGNNRKSERNRSYSSSDEEDESPTRTNGHAKSSSDGDSPRSSKNKSTRPKSSKASRSLRKRHSSESSSTSHSSKSLSSSSDYSTASSDSNSDSVTDVSPMQSPGNSRSPSPPRLQYNDNDINQHSPPVKGSRQKKHSGKDSVRFKEPSPRSGHVRPSSSKQGQHESSGTVLDDSEAQELSMLLRAVLELEETPQRSELRAFEQLQHSRPSSGKRPMSGKSKPHQRMNMSFSNDEVRRIDRENQMLLKNIMHQPTSVPTPEKRTKSARVRTRSYGSSAARPTSGHISHSALLRQKDQRRIEMENMKFLQRLESAKPTSELQRSKLTQDFDKQQQYSAQVSKAPGRPLSGKRTDTRSRNRGMSKASSMQSLQSDFSHFSSASSRSTSTRNRSRPSSAKYASETSQQSSKPDWDEHWSNY